MSCRVYIADDSEVLCARLIEKFLEFEDLEIVGVAHNFPDAVKDIETFQPDVTVLDIQMPGGSGIEILNIVKKSKTANKVIIFTNYPYPQYRKKCLDAGADYFFDKYTEFNEFFRVVKKLVKEHSRQEACAKNKNFPDKLKKKACPTELKN